jgi:hypothetical protein
VELWTRSCPLRLVGHFEFNLRSRLDKFRSASARSLFAARMHNDDVVRLVRRGSSVPEIVGKINASESGFSMWPEGLTALRKAGVPEVVIQAMSARQIGRRIRHRGQPELAGP